MAERKPKCRLEVNYQVEGLKNDTARFRKAAEWVARKFDLASMDVSIAIVDDPTIHELNREHLEHDWPTDVISFVFEFDEETGAVEGEIIASVDTARRLAEQAGWQTEDELLLYITHGLLHLAGLDDIEPDEQLEMRQHERDCLVDLGVVGAEEHLARWNGISY